MCSLFASRFHKYGASGCTFSPNFAHSIFVFYFFPEMHSESTYFPIFFARIYTGTMTILPSTKFSIHLTITLYVAFCFGGGLSYLPFKVLPVSGEIFFLAKPVFQTAEWSLRSAFHAACIRLICNLGNGFGTLGCSRRFYKNTIFCTLFDSFVSIS